MCCWCCWCCHLFVWSRQHASYPSLYSPNPPMNHRSSIPLSWLPPLALAVVHAATNSCVGRLGYDLEGKCKDIVARRSARGGGGGGGAKAGRSSPNAKGSAARRDAGNSSRSAAPNYTSESVIEDIYGGVAAQQAGTGSRDRATRASRRSASSVSWRFLARVRRRGGGGGSGGLCSLRAPPHNRSFG